MPQFENTDSRTPGEWLTRYPEARAKWWIIGEAIYLAVLMFGVPALILVIWIGGFRATLGLTEDRYSCFSHYSYAWLAGTFGGTMFAVKWLYHSVARHYWNEDRRLWRLFCPHLSGGLAFIFLATVSSGLFSTMNVVSLRKPSAIIACAFLVGYFSDGAIGKLKEVADTLFGRREKEAEHEKSAQESPRSTSGDEPSAGNRP